MSHYYTEPHGFYRKDVVVVGGKNSAAIAALELYRAGARVTLVHRRPALAGVDQVLDPPRHREPHQGGRGGGAILVAARVDRRAHGDRSRTKPRQRDEIPAEAVLLMTGYHPDTSLLLTCAGAAIDPETLKPRLDPATFETDVPGLFVAGSAVSGRETRPHLHRERPVPRRGDRPLDTARHRHFLPGSS